MVLTSLKKRALPFKVHNESINTINAKLKELSLEEDNITYVDNDAGFIKDSIVCEDVYNQKDRSGVHLNGNGLMILSDNLSEGIKTSYIKACQKGTWNCALYYYKLHYH